MYSLYAKIHIYRIYSVAPLVSIVMNCQNLQQVKNWFLFH